jgi:hypothetical protein
MEKAMPTLSVMFGAVLTLLGLVAYYRPDLIAGGNPEQPTALAPAGVGVLLLLAGVIGMVAPTARKHAMHLAAAVALLGTLGGLVPVFLRNFDLSQTAVRVGLGMAILSVLFLALCVNSFVQARVLRRSGEQPPQPVG